MRIIRLIVGILLLTAGLPLLLSAGGLWTVGQHRDPDGAFRATLESVDVPGQALLVADLDGLLRRDAAFARAGDTRIRIDAVTDEGPAFVGLAPAAEAMSYLRSARHTWVEQIALARGPLPIRAGTIAGSRTPVADPARQTFWTRTDIGGLTWTADEIRDRDLALVVMTHNGRPAGTVAITAELRPGWLTAATWGGLGGGLLLIIGGMIVLAWPSRPRELVYVVEPDRLPAVAARLSSHASVIHAGADDQLVTRITSRPRRRANHAADPLSDAAPAGPLPGAAPAEARPATLADVSRAASDGEAAVPMADARPASPAGALVEDASVAGAVDERGTVAAKTKARTTAHPPVTPQLTWPPLTRDAAGDTSPPVPAGDVSPPVPAGGARPLVPAGAAGQAAVGESAPAVSVPAASAPAVSAPVTAAAAVATDAEPDTAEIVVAPRKRARTSAADTAKVRAAGAGKTSATNAAKAPAAKASARRAANAGAGDTRSGAPADMPSAPAALATSAPAPTVPASTAPAASVVPVEQASAAESAPVKRQPRRRAAAQGTADVDATAGSVGRRGSGGTPVARGAADRDGGDAGSLVAGAGEGSTVPVDAASDLDVAAPAPRTGRRRKAVDGEVAR